MSEYRLASEAEAELDDIWLSIARESGSVDLATRIVERITDRFGLLATLILAVLAMRICGRGCAPFPQRTT
ncbi:MAG: hypothetical protein WBY44_13135 [Bryobacteraceae bacterium]|jgi:hypothetical protein